jgi:hypothetical protein
MIKYNNLEVDTPPARCRGNLSHKGATYMEKGFDRMGIKLQAALLDRVLNYTILQFFNYRLEKGIKGKS